MPEVTVVYWRDIPAQVIVGKGRSGSKVQLPERFEQAIDRCAMKIGARDADACSNRSGNCTFDPERPLPTITCAGMSRQ